MPLMGNPALEFSLPPKGGVLWSTIRLRVLLWAHGDAGGLAPSDRKRSEKHGAAPGNSPWKARSSSHGPTYMMPSPGTARHAVPWDDSATGLNRNAVLSRERGERRQTSGIHPAPDAGKTEPRCGSFDLVG